jgi:diguanylate cyclase (GGDEF)-like protein
MPFDHHPPAAGNTSPSLLPTMLWAALFRLHADAAQAPMRARQVQLRLKPLALALAALVLSWTVADFLVLPAAQFGPVLVARLLLAALLVGLALLPAVRTQRDVLLRLFALMVLQVAFYAWMSLVVGRGEDSLLSLGYSLFPLLVVTQIAIFPLAVGEALLLAAPAVAAALVAVLGSEVIDHFAIGNLWLLAALTGIASAAAASQLALLLSLLGARQQASEDALTGLANRRMLDHQLTAELARARRDGKPLSAIVLDLDRFKRVNDSLGHAAGDDVLVHIAHILRAELRGADLAARYGGEEFCLLLPGISAEDAWWVAERIRQRVESNPTVLASGESVPITVSLGIATLTADDSAETLIERADRAMYRAKQNGRNRSVAL